jgi:hypothetical protein
MAPLCSPLFRGLATPVEALFVTVLSGKDSVILYDSVNLRVHSPYNKFTRLTYQLNLTESI